MAKKKAKARKKVKPKAKPKTKVKKARCAAKTKEGKKCKNSVAGKSKFCAVHRKK